MVFFGIQTYHFIRIIYTLEHDKIVLDTCIQKIHKHFTGTQSVALRFDF